MATFTFRLTAEGITQFRRDLDALGPAGTQAFDQLKRSSPQLASALDRAGASADRVREKITQAGDRPPRALRSLAGAGDEAARGLQNLAVRAGPVGLFLSRLGPAGIAAGVAVGGLTLGLTKATRAALEFNLTLSRIVGLVGVARGEVEDLSAAALGMAGRVGKGPQELAEALFFVTSAGLRGAAATETLEAAARAATAGLGETKTVADIVTSALNAYGTEALSAGDATGILVATIREGKAEPEAIAGSLGRVIPIAAELGVEFHELGAAVAAMTRLGFSAELSVTALLGVLQKILKPAKQGVEALDEVGLSLDQVRESLAEKGLLATLRLLQDALADNERGVAAFFEDVQGLNGVLALVGKSAAAADGIFARMAQAGVKDLDTAFAAAAEEGAVKLKMAQAELDAQWVRLGTHTAPLAAGAIDLFSAALRGLSDAFEDVGRRASEPAVETVFRRLLDVFRPEIPEPPGVTIDLRASAMETEDREAGEAIRAAEKAADAAEQATARKAAAERKFHAELRKLETELEESRFKARDKALDGLDALRAATADATADAIEKIELRRDRELAIYQELRDEEIIREQEFAEARALIHERADHEIAEARRKEQEKTAREAERLAKEHAREVEKAVDRATENSADFLFDAFEGKIEDIGELLRRTLHRAIADAVAQRFLQPLIIQPIVAGIMGGPGTAGGAAGAGGISAPGGLGGSGAGGVGIADAVSLGSLFAAGQATGLGSFLANTALELGLGDATAGFLGNAGLNAPFGIIGSLGANLLGLGGGIGGTVGGIAGSFLGGGIGASLGTILGLPGGPVGAVIGSFLGTALGGLFGGGGRARSFGHAEVVRDPGGTFGVGDIATKRLGEDVLAEFGAAAQGLFNTLDALDGFDVLFDRIGAIIIDADRQARFGLNVPGAVGTGLPSAPHVLGASIDTDAETALIKGVRALLERGDVEASETLATVIGNTTAKTLQEFGEDLDFGVFFENLDFIPEDLTEAERILEAIAEQFAAAADNAERLGLSVDKLIAKRDQALAELTEGFDDEVRLAILRFTDPVTAALDELAIAQERRVREAEALGADLVEIERLNALERQAVVERFAGAGANDNLRRFLDELTFGGVSGASPTASREGLAARFEEAAALALAGDAAARGEVVSLGTSLLESSRDVFASAGGFQDDLARVREVTEQLLGGEAGSATVTALNEGFGTQASLLAELIDEMAAVRRLNEKLVAQNAQLTAEIERQLAA